MRTAADATLQLNKNAGATYMYAASFGDSLEFIPVAKEIYTYKYVGYKHLTNDELITNKSTAETLFLSVTFFFNTTH